MSFTGPFEDRMLIRERIGSYSDATFRGDCEAWLSNWSEDCVWTFPGAEFRGKQAMRDQWQTLWSSLRKMAFFAEIGSIEIHGDRAAARCYCHEVVLMKAGGVRTVVGAYADELVREQGIWRFARRDYRLFIDEGLRGAAKAP